MNSKALVKSETTFLKRVCPLLYPNVTEGVNKILTDDLPSVQGAHCTTDHWTSRSNDAYPALTFQYVTASWEFKKWTVECCSTKGRLTADLVAAITDQMIKNVPGSKHSTFTTITTDSASNMSKAIKDALTIDSHLSCIDHIINVCVNKALEEELVSKYRNVRI